MEEIHMLQIRDERLDQFTSDISVTVISMEGSKNVLMH